MDQCVGGYIVRKNKFGEPEMLIIQRSTTDPRWPLHWEMPRGHVKDNEVLTEALKREIREETGLTINIIKKINIIKYISKDRVTIMHNFLCEMVDPNQQVKLSYEHQNFYWVKSFAELEMMVPPEQFRTAGKIFRTDAQLVNCNSEDSEEVVEEMYTPNYRDLRLTRQ